MRPGFHHQGPLLKPHMDRLMTSGFFFNHPNQVGSPDPSLPNSESSELVDMSDSESETYDLRQKSYSSAGAGGGGNRNLQRSPSPVSRSPSPSPNKTSHHQNNDKSREKEVVSPDPKKVLRRKSTN
jgi:hypothetical protein